jgi:hypothetical protein
MSDDLAERRYREAVQKDNYKRSLSSLMARVVADWQKTWVEDCKKKGRTIPFGKWCLVPLDENDPMSSPFEIANVYTEDTFRDD